MKKQNLAGWRKKHASLSLGMLAVLGLQTGPVAASQYLQRGRDYLGQTRAGQFTAGQAARFSNWMQNTNVANVVNQYRAGNLTFRQAAAQLKVELGAVGAVVGAVAIGAFLRWAMMRRATASEAAAQAQSPVDMKLLQTALTGDLGTIGTLVYKAEQNPTMYSVKILNYAIQNIYNNTTLMDYAKESLAERLRAVIRASYSLPSVVQEEGIATQY